MQQIPKIIIITALLFMGACRKSSIHGSGTTVTETRALANFTNIQTNDKIDVHIVKGAVQKVDVRGYSNLVPITETQVVNNTLIIKYKSEYYNVRNSNLEVLVTLPVLSGASTNGSAELSASGFLNGTQLSIGINGSSNVRVINSSYDQVTLDVNGSGSIGASSLLAKNADATIHGSGSIEISCVNNLKARIFGSGSIDYWGTPAVDAAVSGTGKVKRK